jgi:gluconate 2-dehydrogenase gamma chain
VSINRSRRNTLEAENQHLSRRRFLQLAGAAAVTTTVAETITACETPQNPVQIPVSGSGPVPIGLKYPNVPSTPVMIPEPSERMFFSEEEARLIDAITARIMPGNSSDPGAREAGVMNYIDRKLAEKDNQGFVEYTYFRPPFAKVYEGNNPPQAKDTGQEIWVKKSELNRYGFQSSQTPQEKYRAGLTEVNQYALSQFHKKFTDLSEEQQDQILTDMENGKTKSFSQPGDQEFFKTLRQDTIEGMFSDPAYGGNRDMLGWKLIGYPGAQRAYTPVDLLTEGNVRPPQSILQLHQFHPGQMANPDVIVPQSGSNLEKKP